MTKVNKFLIGEIIALLVLIGLIVSIFFVDADLGVFKIVSQKTLSSQYNSIKDLDTKLLSAKTNYETSIRSVETAKSDYQRQKEQYEAITDETISIIKEATTEEKYNIEYMWIKLGNYATANNLTLGLVEPGGAAQSASTTTQTPTEGTEGTEGGTTTSAPASSSGNELQISVKGSYTDVSSFIFDLENDAELRFKLDKIKMEYAGSNQINTTFAVKNLKFIK